jgi:hypothetical protein
VPALQVSGDVLERALKRIAAKSGVVNWTYQLIVALARASDSAFSATLGFVNLILRGKLPRIATLLDSLLIGLQKPDGDNRVVAIGEAWCRLAMLCATISVAEMGQALPLQLGAFVSGGVEAVTHAVRTHLDTDLLRVLAACCSGSGSCRAEARAPAR